jgi:formylglycine-generating enzyme required for sulfatase activity
MKNLDIKRITLILLVTLMLPLSAMSQMIRGDVNQDGQVNVADVTALIRHILDGKPYSVYADVTHDRNVNVADVTFLINMILGFSDPVRTFTVNGVSFNMIRVEAGTFTMGADDEMEGGLWVQHNPAHQVTITKSYYVSETEVTQELWLAVMGDVITYANHDPQKPINMIDVSWCEQFCRQLEDSTAMPFRLLTEAEWEFAARGGNLSRGYTYAGSDNIDEVAWYQGNTGDEVLHRVATKAPNELGIYDMTGNADEWVKDYYSHYPNYPVVDPCCTEPHRRIVRGGASYCTELTGRVVHRDWASDYEYGQMRTLRLAFTAP